MMDDSEIPEDIERTALAIAEEIYDGGYLHNDIIARALMAERSRIKALLLEHESLAGPYVHDLIRAIDE